LKIIGSFSTSLGTYQVVEGLRDQFKPSWEEMLIPVKGTSYIPEESGIVLARKEVELLKKELLPHGVELGGKHVLDIGCHMGKHAYLMSEDGATVNGIDVLEYGIRQSADLSCDEEGYKEEQRVLDQLREHTAKAVSEEARKRVFFDNLDATEMDFKEEFDLVVSWDVLEHITKPQLALENMYEALRPKGMCYHRYNPFFSLNGGHSLCTTDIIYGHCLLSGADFERYLNIYRPKEFNQAMLFYKYNLNRMSITDLKGYCEEAGFEILDIKRYANVDLNNASSDIASLVLPTVQKHYPSVQLDDLLYDTVDIILCKH